MSKQNFLFIFIGILVGFIGGFVFANGINRSEATQQSRSVAATAGATNNPTAQTALPANAVAEQGSAPGIAQGTMPPEIRAALDHAKNEPGNFEAQAEAANLYYQIQRYEPALGYLQRAHELRPDDYDVIVRLGSANFYLERYDEAGRWYARAHAMRPDDVGVGSDLGLTYYLRGNLDEAIAAYRRSLERDPRHEESLQNLTVALRDKKNLDEARQTLARLEAAHPQNESIARLRESLARN